MPLINNVEAGRQFAKTARAVLARDIEKADSTNWFTLEDMLTIAERFGISGVFNSDGLHWRLVLNINEDSTLKVYDPLYSRKGRQIYDYLPPVDSVSMPSRDLQKQFQIRGGTLFSSEAERLVLLRQKGYALKLPGNFAMERLQDDGYNCGPLVVYAALVGDKYTPHFSSVAKFLEVKQASGIDII
ncbi:MAG TPA: hypothetical protein VJC21_00630 [Candidatus Nanoarchaeia archaeon]|nr:hypothetical protein [Candidatus Nanoarchaeia archaeon]